jgi:3-phenylpropionate/trans-cinnamate dioxygenase ferredoxin subunit
MSDYQRVAAVDEIAPGSRIEAIVDDRAILVLRVGDDFFAIEDVCTHDGQPLTDGPLRGVEIQCPRHGARFDVTTGRALCMPAVEPVATFEVKVENGQVYVGPEKS